MAGSPPSESFEVYNAGATTLEISTLVKMVLLVRGFRNRLDEHLRKIGQTTARMETLSAILNMPGEKSQSDIAKRLRVEGATVTRMIDVLGREGLVERKPHPCDRRINLVSITPEGRKVLQEIFRTYDMLRGHLLEGTSPEELELLQSLVDRMLGRLDLPVDQPQPVDVAS